MRKTLLSLFCLNMALLAMAQPQEGKVYNLKNVGKNNSLGMSNTMKGIAVATNTEDLAQLWYVESTDAFSLRNLASGMYLKGHNSASNAWTLVTTEVELEFTTATNGYAIREKGHTGTHAYLHIDGSGNAVSWEHTSNTNSQWLFNEVSFSEDELNKLLASLESLNVTEEAVKTYQSALDALFADKACSELKAPYSEYSDPQLQSDPNYIALPATLQQMVLKVRSNSWDEANGNPSKQKWDSEYAKKYRVQLYEPYNEPEAAAKALKINAHTNLNNPTGIYSAAQSLMYVMVEGEIKEGASLYLASYTGNGKLGGYAEGTELKTGLNVIPSYSANNNYCINYVVHTFDTSDNKSGKAACKRKLSDYPDLKIHIEGGHINGYYNKVGDDLYVADKNADWNYLEARATQTDVTILGKYITLQFPLNDGDTEGNKGMSYYLNDRVKVEDVINEWDNVMLWERLLMGVVDEPTVKANAKKSPYSDAQYTIDYIGNNGGDYACDYGDYYNVHGLSFGVGGSSYMYGSWDHCGYHYNTMGGVIESLPTNAGSHWGPGHEIGHQHQGPLNMRGLTEVTNNLFSNVVLWYYGESTSRYNGSDGALFNILNAFNTKGSDFFTNNIWAQTHMYYKLFLYYHVLGKNPKFYPVLFEMLRQDPMTIEYEQSGVTSLLHFYKKCCLASGNDLTEFFRAHGFFRVMKDRFVGDYSNANYNMTQAQINAAIAEVKALNYPENIAVLFINDATGETIKSHKGDNLDFYGESVVCADLGSYASFATLTNPEYTYSLSALTMTMEGAGGIGFAIVNDKGEVVSFSDKNVFGVSEECAQLLVSSKAKVMAVKADGTFVEAKDFMDTAGQAQVYAKLGELLELSEKMISKIDTTDTTKPGFFKASEMTSFIQAYDNAKTAYDKTDANSYTAVYDLLSQAYFSAMANQENRVPFIPGSTYVLTNNRYSAKSIGIDGEGKLISSNTDLSAKTQQWVFEPTDEEDIYYIKNASTQKYLGTLLKSTEMKAEASDTQSAKAYKLYNLDNALWALQCQTDKDQMSLHIDGSNRVLGWTHTGADNNASWWYLTATEVDTENLIAAELTTLIEKSEALLSQVGSVREHCPLSTEAGSAFRLTDNNGASEGSLANLLDGKINTYYVSNWSNNALTAPYLQVEAADENELGNFSITYTTRESGGAPVPAAIEISASMDGVNYEVLQTFKKDTDSLPAASNAESWTSPTYGEDGARYRYMRFTVTEGYRTSGSSNNSKGICHFGISEFKINNRLIDIEPEYASFSDSLLLAFHRAIKDAEQALASAQSQQEYADAYSKLEAEYEAFLAAKNEADNVDLTGKKAELLNLINKTQALIESCGTITYTEEVADTKVALQTTDESASGHLYCNAPYLNKDNGDKSPVEKSYWLLDNNYSTYLHTDYENTAPNEDHYLRVYISEEGIESFKFNYSTRNGAYLGNPAEIVVEGSAEANGTYTPIKTLSSQDAENPLPTAEPLKHYTSDVLGNGTSYKYLRFRVTANEGKRKSNDHHWFYMSEFGLTKVGSSGTYTASLKDSIGSVTEELLIAAYKEVLKAQAIYNIATTEAQLLMAINGLQEKYDTLLNAKYINVEVSSIELDSTSITLTEGESMTLTATVTPNYAYNRKVTWSSSEATIATVDANGKVVAVAPGNAVITAKAGEKTATCSVTVEKKVIAVDGITLSQTSATLIEGDSITLTATVTPEDATDKTVTWTTSDAEVATVDANGKVIAVAPGNAVITAKAGEKTATCTVTVEKKVIAVDGITLSQTSATLVEGDSITLTATVTPEDATDKTVTWTTSDAEVATVDANGKVIAVGPGTAVITAKAGEFTATCEITVTIIDSIDDLKELGIEVVVYSLEGRRITDTDNLKPGLYIVNGKKMLIGKKR